MNRAPASWTRSSTGTQVEDRPTLTRGPLLSCRRSEVGPGSFTETREDQGRPQTYIKKETTEEGAHQELPREDMEVPDTEIPRETGSSPRQDCRSSTDQGQGLDLEVESENE